MSEMRYRFQSLSLLFEEKILFAVGVFTVMISCFNRLEWHYHDYYVYIERKSAFLNFIHIYSVIKAL